jgi:hypothetical protein
MSFSEPANRSRVECCSQNQHMINLNDKTKKTPLSYPNQLNFFEIIILAFD